MLIAFLNFVKVVREQFEFIHLTSFVACFHDLLRPLSSDLVEGAECSLQTIDVVRVLDQIGEDVRVFYTLAGTSPLVRRGRVRCISKQANAALRVCVAGWMLEQRPDVWLLHGLDNLRDMWAPALEVVFHFLFRCGHNPLLVFPGIARAKCNHCGC